MRGIWFAVFAGTCWGIGEVFTKSVLHSGKVGPLTAIAVRSTVALPFLWLACWWALSGAAAEPKDWFRADSSVLLKLILGSGLIAGAGGMIGFTQLSISVKSQESNRSLSLSHRLSGFCSAGQFWAKQ